MFTHLIADRVPKVYGGQTGRSKFAVSNNEILVIKQNQNMQKIFWTKSIFLSKRFQILREGKKDIY